MATDRPTVTIDCSNVVSADELWQRYLDATQPEGGEVFGRNLDAFWDAIEGGGPGDPGPVKLVFAHAAALERLTTFGGASFLQCLQDIADHAQRIEVIVR